MNNNHLIDKIFELKVFSFASPLYKKYREIICYLIIGFLTTVVSLIVYYGCTLTFLNPLNPIQLQIANILSWIFAVAFAYITNRKIVFNSCNQNILKEIISFVGSRIITLFLDMGFMFLLVTKLDLNDKISKLLVQFLVIVGNYILSKLFVFRKKSIK